MTNNKKYELPNFSESILNYCKEQNIQIIRNQLNVIQFERCSTFNKGRRYVFHISNKGELTFNTREHTVGYTIVNVWFDEEELEFILKIVKELKNWIATKFFCDCLHNKIKETQKKV